MMRPDRKECRARSVTNDLPHLVLPNRSASFYSSYNRFEKKNYRNCFFFLFYITSLITLYFIEVPYRVIRFHHSFKTKSNSIFSITHDSFPFIFFFKENGKGNYHVEIECISSSVRIKICLFS